MLVRSVGDAFSKTAENVEDSWLSKYAKKFKNATNSARFKEEKPKEADIATPLPSTSRGAGLDKDGTVELAKKLFNAKSEELVFDRKLTISGHRANYAELAEITAEGKTYCVMANTDGKIAIVNKHPGADDKTTALEKLPTSLTNPKRLKEFNSELKKLVSQEVSTIVPTKRRPVEAEKEKEEERRGLSKPEARQVGGRVNGLAVTPS